MHPTKTVSSLILQNIILAFSKACEEDDAADWRPIDTSKDSARLKK